MIIIIILGVLLIIGILMWIFIDEYKHDWLRFSGIMITVVSSIFLFLFLLAIPINQNQGLVDVQKYNAIKETIANSRIQGISDLERATLTTTIIETNKELASAKYWNGTTMDIFINDEYAELEYLK